MFRERFKPDPDDIVIVVIGPTGSGKTNFINSLTGNKEHGSASNLKSNAQKVTPHPISHQGFRLVLVDTPGFDDTYREDIVILKMIADWLIQKYPDGTTLKIAGIVYAHRIADNRMSGSANKNLQMFGRLCGNIPLPRTRLVTTMWDLVKDKGVAKQRENDLIQHFWQKLLAGGAVACQFDNRSASAWAIINSLLRMENDGDLLLQEELVEQGKRLNETEAGKVLYNRLQKLLAEQKRTLKEPMKEAKVQNDPTLARSLQEECEKIDARLQKTFEEMKMMKIPLSRRIVLWLFSKNLAHSRQQSHRNTKPPAPVSIKHLEPGNSMIVAEQQNETDTERPETARRPLAPAPASIEDLEQEDSVIAVIGPKGSGKSTIARIGSSPSAQSVGQTSKSSTSHIQATRFWNQESGEHVVLVDTPGFGDTSTSDLEVLNMVSDWLDSGYEKRKLLSGVLYLRRIADDRLAVTPLKDIQLLQKLCGKDGLDKVWLTTTMWDRVDSSVGERELAELKQEPWKTVISQGAQVARCRSDDDSPKQLIQQVLNYEATREVVLLREEMISLKMEFEETETGQELYAQLEELIEGQMSLLQRINKERKAASDVGVLERLRTEYDDLQSQIDDKFRQMQELTSSQFNNLLRSLH